MLAVSIVTLATAHADPKPLHLRLRDDYESTFLQPGASPMLHLDIQDQNLTHDEHYELTKAIGPITLRFTMDTHDRPGTGVAHTRRASLELRKDWRVTRWIRPFVSLTTWWQETDGDALNREYDGNSKGLMLRVGTTF